MPDKENFGKNYFNGETSGYSNGYKLNKGMKIIFKSHISKIKKYNKNKNLKICDIGCAYGYFLKCCEKEDWKLFGMDISEMAVDKANEFLKAKIKRGNIENFFPFKSKFNVITSFEVLEHLNNPEKAIKNIFYNLEDEGIFFMSTPNPKCYLYRKIFFNYIDEDKTHISLKNKEDWEKILESNNFNILYSKTKIYNEASDSFLAKFGFITKILSFLGYGFTTEIIAKK